MLGLFVPLWVMFANEGQTSEHLFHVIVSVDLSCG